METNPFPIPVIKSPLDIGHLQQIRQSLAILEQLQPEITKAKQAGIDVSQQEASIADSKQKLLSIKNVYFPGQ